MHVEAKGVPKHVAVKIYNVVHLDDMAYKGQDELGRLTLHDGRVIENVEEIQVDPSKSTAAWQGTVFAGEVILAQAITTTLPGHTARLNEEYTRH